MKLATLVLGAALTLSSLTAGRAWPQPCLYYAETPTGTEAYYGLEDAQDALRAIGVDPFNTPVGYDVTSRRGC